MDDLSRKVHDSIERLKAFCPPEGYYLAFSGGKDSVVCKALMDMAGVRYDATYRVKCSNKLCFCETNWADFSEEDAAERWNRRAENGA